MGVPVELCASTAYSGPLVGMHLERNLEARIGMKELLGRGKVGRQGSGE